jgi:hypothetical protein
MSKASALQLVTQFAARTARGRWSHIRRADLAAGLTVRINDPNRIAQRATPLCGPASLVRAVASSNPDAYARAAIELFENGRTRINNLAIQPGRELIGDPPEGNTDVADWILLASIRDSDNWFFSPSGIFGSNLAGITRPGTLESWLREAGYKSIVNKTYLVAKPIMMALAAELAEASRYFARGYKVMLFLDADVLSSDTQDDLISMHPDHWVALNSTVRDGGIVNYDAPIQMELWSWGRRVTVPVNAAKPLKKRQFLHKYYGYIAGKP